MAKVTWPVTGRGGTQTWALGSKAGTSRLQRPRVCPGAGRALGARGGLGLGPARPREASKASGFGRALRGVHTETAREPAWLRRPACRSLEAAMGSSGGTLPCTEPPLTPTRPRGAQQVCRAQSTSPPALCTPGGSGPHLGNGALGKMTPSSNVLWPSASTHLAHTCVSHSAVPAPTC